MTDPGEPDSMGSAEKAINSVFTWNVSANA